MQNKSLLFSFLFFRMMIRRKEKAKIEVKMCIIEVMKIVILTTPYYIHIRSHNNKYKTDYVS